MSNERERLAREWAEIKLAMPTGHLDADVIAAAEHILATTTDPLTMADVEWDHEKHYLAGAHLDASNRDAVMLGTWDDMIVVVDVPRESDKSNMSLLVRSTKNGVTPNGKRYRLVEDVEPEHPETLTTVEDYENAPTGTVVTRKGCEPWAKRDSDDWCITGGHKSRMDYHMADSKRDVLRWGWGE